MARSGRGRGEVGARSGEIGRGRARSGEVDGDRKRSGEITRDRGEVGRGRARLTEIGGDLTCAAPPRAPPLGLYSLPPRSPARQAALPMVRVEGEGWGEG